MLQLPATAQPPHRLNLSLRVMIFTRIASHIYDLSLSSRGDETNFDETNFLGRIEQKSDNLWAVTYIDCQPCMPEYFDNWQQATVYLFEMSLTQI